MGDQCEGFFTDRGIPFEAAYEADAVWTVWSTDGLEYGEAKSLIVCWFDVTYGAWNGNRFDLRDSRTKMSEYLTRSPFRTFEELIDAPFVEKPPSKTS